MKLLLDDLRPDHVRHATATYPISGVTSNPTIVKAAGLTDIYEGLAVVREIIGADRSLHVQVIAEDTDGMLREADRILEKVGPGTCIKVPVTEAGLRAIRRLKADGTTVTATAIYSTMQGLLAIGEGADHLAPYVNRMQNLDVDPFATIRALAQNIARTNSPAQILAASFKNIHQVTAAVEAGAHSVTVSPDLLTAATGSSEVHRAVRAFARDWESALGTTTLP